MGTHYRGNKKEVRALNAYIKLMRAGESLNARVHQHLAEYGISSSQFAVLEILKHLGPQCQKDLGKKLLKTGGNIVLIVDNLEKGGLVSRKREGKDRRYVTVKLTQQGKNLIDRIFPNHVAGIVKEMNILDIKEQEELGKMCKKLGLQKK